MTSTSSAVVPDPTTVTPQLLAQHSITAEEYERILAALGRTPSLTELGIYSVIASSVALRRREIGIRFALGATPVQVMRLAVRDGVVLAAIGTALGIGAALLATRLLRALLFGVVPWDPVTFAMTVAVMAAAALAAAIRPAHRAAQVDPMVVLRDE